MDLSGVKTLPAAVSSLQLDRSIHQSSAHDYGGSPFLSAAQKILLYAELRGHGWTRDWLTSQHARSTRGHHKRKGKGSSLDIAPLTILDSGALQPQKWQLIGTGCNIIIIIIIIINVLIEVMLNVIRCRGTLQRRNTAAQASGYP